MTLPLMLSDPQNVANKPGEGPVRQGGRAPSESLTIQSSDNLPSTVNAAVARQLPSLTIVRDLEVGAEQVRAKAMEYLPKAPGEETDAYLIRLQRSVFHNFFLRTVEGLAGLVFRVNPTFGDDVPAQIVEHWENIDNAGTHGDVFVRNTFTDALLTGHTLIFVDYPNTGGRPLTLAEERPLRPYWLLIPKDNVVSFRMEVENGGEVLTQIVLRETTMVPKGVFGETTQTRYRVLRRTVPETSGRPVVTWQLLEVGPNRAVMLIDEGEYPTQTEIPIAEVTTSGRQGPFESVPPLLDLAYLNIAHYQQWSDYATSLHMTCVPILFGAGIDAGRDERGMPKKLTVGPGTGVWSVDPNAKLAYVSHDGQALGACKVALDDLKSDMGTLGLAMLAPQKRAAETAEAKRLDKSTTDSALAVAVRGLEDAVERALGFHARYLGLATVKGGSIEVNRDFEGLLMDASVMSAYGALVRDAGFPARLVLEMLQRGGRIPEDADLDEIEMEMAAEAAAAADQRRMIAESMAGEHEEEEEEEEGEEEVIAAGNPYKVVKRDGQWAVVKANSGALVKKHTSKKQAVAHFRALEANVED